MKLEKAKELAPFTTFKLGGPAQYFIEITNLNELLELLELGQVHGLPIFILGGGSNLLIRDEGFAGVVVRVCLDACAIDRDTLTVTIGAGRAMPQLVAELCAAGFSCLEWAGGLPGTFGGAIRGNAGCFGREIKDVTISVRALNLRTHELHSFTNAECAFTYRTSYFKLQPEWLIVEATLTLVPDDVRVLIAAMTEKVNFRRERHPLELPNAGSIFKNVPVEQASAEIIELATSRDKIKQDPFPVVPAAFIIDTCGLRGITIGGAEVSTKHANFIVNARRARSRDVLDLIALVKDRVKARFDTILEEEIQIV